jgi:2-methylcitrate dehydratase PrpD
VTVAELLGDFVSHFEPERLSPTALDIARRAVLDVLGAAAAGVRTVAATAARNVAIETYAPGSARIWFSEGRAAVAGAVFANCAAASALDLDDGSRAAGGHPGAAVIPAVLAAAHARATDGQRVLSAIFVGYEVAVRIAAARDFARLDTLSSGRWCGIGVAAALAHLHRLSAPEAAQALAIAGVVAPGLSASGYSHQMGNSVKEGIAWAAVDGVQAVALAGRGYCGPLDVFDHPDYYDAAAIAQDLTLEGAPGAIESIYFKPYGCCRWSHAAIDAAIALRHQLARPVQAIEAIEVATFSRALRLSNELAPTSLEGVQYSVPFCIAAVLIDGPECLLPARAELLGRDDIISLAHRVCLSATDEYDGLFPEKVPARVKIRTRGQVLEAEVRDPLGDPANPMDLVALRRKFSTLARSVPAVKREQLADAALALGTSPPGVLLDAIDACATGCAGLVSGE